MRFGSLIRLAETAGGAFAVGAFNDAFTAPFVDRTFPTFVADHTMSKAVDTGTTFGTAVAAGFVLRKLGLGRLADPIEEGGQIVAALKGIATLIPGFEVKLTTPSPLSLFRATNAAAPAGSTATPGQQQIGGGTPTPGGGSQVQPQGSAALTQGNIPPQYIVGGIGAATSPNTNTGF